MLSIRFVQISLYFKFLDVRTGWKEKFVRGYYRRILHLRLRGKNRPQNLNFKVKILFFSLYCILLYYEGKTFPRNHRSQPNQTQNQIKSNSLAKKFLDRLTLRTRVLTATLWTRGCNFYISNNVNSLTGLTMRSVSVISPYRRQSH